MTTSPSRSPEPRASIAEAGGFPAVVPQLDGLLWTFLALVAAGLRLAQLGAAPLSGAEARQALAAYAAVYGELPVAVTGIGSPLLYHFNVLLFTLFEGGEAWVRLAPALAGIGLALTPLLLRRHLGRWGALAMGFLLALSPTTLLFSRTLEDAVPAALGIMLLLGGSVRYFETQRTAWGVLAAVGFGLAIVAGAAAWGFLLGLVLSLAVALWMWRERLGNLAALVRPVAGWWLLVVGGVLLLLSTGLLLHPAGLAATGAQFLEWLNRFGLPDEMFTPAPLTLMLTYELLILLMGLAGLLLSIYRRNDAGLLLSLWAVLSWLQLTLALGRETADLLWLILPLAGLAGLAVQALAEGLLAYGHWLNEGLYLPVSLIMWAHFGLTLAAYVQRGQARDFLVLGLSLLLQLFLLIIFGLVFAFPESGPKSEDTLRQGLGAALRAGGLVLGIVLVVINFSIAWNVAYVRPADPRELLTPQPTAVEVGVLVDVVEHIGLLEVGSTPELPITFVGDPYPPLVWYFREYDLSFVPRLPQGDVALGGRPPLVLAPPLEQPVEGYFGEVFPLQRDWSPVWAGPVTVFRSEESQGFLDWWLYRDTSSPPAVTRWIALWVREDLSTSGLTFGDVSE